MQSINRIIIAGTLTRDPELRYTPKGAAVAKIGLALNRKFKTESGEPKEETTFVDVDVFGRDAENAAQFLKKGRQALVEGRLKLDQWDDRQTGQKRQRLIIVSEHIHFLGVSPKASPSAPPMESGE